MEINGIWKGEYIAQEDFGGGTVTRAPIPFVMRIKASGENGDSKVYDGLFEGICQDDPETTKMTPHATICGSVKLDTVYFVKQYVKLVTQDWSGKVTVYDELHSEIYYTGKYTNNCFYGTWSINRSFRKINNQLFEILPQEGTWWMIKM
jgi:hypothetical protein